MITEVQQIIQAKYKLTPIQMAHFLGQCAHESNNFTVVYENLNYSAQGLANTWPNRYAINPKSKIKSPNKLALSLARNPQAIANNAYANRGGNRDEKSGDGWKYRGRGFIQLSLEDNYSEFSKFIGDDCVNFPDLVATKYAYDSAIWYFIKNNIFSIANDLNDNTIENVTRKINGGIIGLDDRKAKTIYYYNLLIKK